MVLVSQLYIYSKEFGICYYPHISIIRSSVCFKIYRFPNGTWTFPLHYKETTVKSKVYMSIPYMDEICGYLIKILKSPISPLTLEDDKVEILSMEFICGNDSMINIISYFC